METVTCFPAATCSIFNCSTSAAITWVRSLSEWPFCWICSLELLGDGGSWPNFLLRFSAIFRRRSDFCLSSKWKQIQLNFTQQFSTENHVFFHADRKTFVQATLFAVRPRLHGDDAFADAAAPNRLQTKPVYRRCVTSQWHTLLALRRKNALQDSHETALKLKPNAKSPQMVQTLVFLSFFTSQILSLVEVHAESSDSCVEIEKSQLDLISTERSFPRNTVYSVIAESSGNKVNNNKVSNAIDKIERYCKT